MSDHFDGKRFYDPTHRIKNTFWDFLKWQLTKKRRFWPKSIPNTQFDTPPQKVYGNELRVSNIGHVTFLIQTQGINILTDPVWSKRASPFNFIGPQRIIEPGIKFEELPPIDVVLVSHNHYDHMDLGTLSKLWERDHPRIIVPLANEKIIQNYNPNIFVESYDWGQSTPIKDDIHVHLEAAQHWSARGLFDRNKALWAAFAITMPSGHIYFVGDAGYGEGRYFKAAKEKYEAFRLALLPMGAYEPRWFMRYAHMDPEEMLKAHQDLGSPYTIPSHYDVFRLTDEGYGEATQALDRAMRRLEITDTIKLLGVGEYWSVPEASMPKSTLSP